MQAKLAKLGLDQTPDEFVAGLPAPVKRRVEHLQSLQTKHDELEAQFRKERAELEAKYETLYGQLGRGARRWAARPATCIVGVCACACQCGPPLMPLPRLPVHPQLPCTRSVRR